MIRWPLSCMNLRVGLRLSGVEEANAKLHLQELGNPRANDILAKKQPLDQQIPFFPPM
jgi:hypothetical protein